ncbi:MAG TPA: rhomboid family intramembrane serine protease [Campylobacterales bacterium]|nr:rhomboid family intramembrane serine protease [Campylobacterales bacterium]
MSSQYLLSIGAIFGPSIIIDGELWRLVTAMFLHGGIEHIAMNMLSLWFVGRVMESWFDRVSYISIYFISGIAGGLISIYMHPTTVGIGASGAIFGIFGALSGMVIVHRRRMEEQFKAFMKEFGIILFLNLVIGVVFESVDLSAHIAGLIVGMIGGAMVAKSYKMIWIYISIMVISMILFYNYLYSYLLPLYMSLANAQF